MSENFLKFPGAQALPMYWCVRPKSRLTSIYLNVLVYKDRQLKISNSPLIVMEKLEQESVCLFFFLRLAIWSVNPLV